MFRFDGLDNLKSNLSRMLANVDSAARQGVDSAADFVADEAARLAPQDTGELASNIRATEASHLPGEHLKAVDAVADHALAVEYGTRDTRAQPYIRPVIDERADAVAEVILAPIVEAIGK